MPVKRSRIGRSSSFGETDLSDHVSPPIQSTNRRWEMLTPPPSAIVKPPNNPTEFLNPSIAENTNQSPLRILTFSSPDHDVSDKERIGGFLEKCNYCKKNIRENDEVFMYGYLRAFCSAECRDCQIALDEEVDKQSTKSDKMLAQRHGMNNFKGQLGF